MSAALVLSMLGDARVPTGGHTQSAGLEAMVLAGLDGSGVVQYAAARLRTVTATDAGAAVVARSTWLTGTPDGLAEVSAAWCARTPGRPQREAADRLGRGYARLARRLWPVELADADLRHPRPVVLGVVAAVAGIDAADLARVVAYDELATIGAAALKLLPLDPLDVAAWTLELGADVEVLVDRVRDLDTPGDLPASGAPRLDQLVAQHAVSPRRLFHA